MAKRMGEDPLMVMQNIYFVHGRAGWNTQYVIARANRCGVFRGPLRWESKGLGDNLAVTCYAYLVHAEDGEDPRVEITIDMAMAKADGWTRNEKYKSIPEQMLRWRTAAWLIRLYAPEVMLGYPITDELHDRDSAWGGEVVDVTPPGPRPELRTYKEPGPGHNHPPGPVIEPEPEPVQPPPPAAAAAPAATATAATSTAASPGPSSTGEPEKPKRQRRVLRAQPQPQLPVDLEPFDDEAEGEAATYTGPATPETMPAGLPEEAQGELPPDDLPPVDPAPGALYNVVVPAAASLQAWFKPARDKLVEMQQQGRPPEDFARFRAENTAMIGQMKEGFGFWANSLNELIAKGEHP
jgi:predicted pyridoxine 5'-phosphate oxidase superfamily flavin-nucleotide-binding protein